MAELKTKPEEKQASKQAFVREFSVSYGVGGLSSIDGTNVIKSNSQQFQVGLDKKISSADPEVKQNVDPSKLDPGDYRYVTKTETNYSIIPSQTASLTFTKEKGSMEFNAGFTVINGDLTTTTVDSKKVSTVNRRSTEVDAIIGDSETVLDEKTERIVSPGIFVGASYNTPITKKGVELTLSALAALNIIDKKAIPMGLGVTGTVSIPLNEKIKVSPTLWAGLGGVEGNLEINYAPTGGVGISVSYRVIGEKTLSATVSFGKEF